MKVYIKADMEGVSGILSFDQVKPGSDAYRSACRLFTDEINAAIEGALAGGAEEITVYDMHWSGRNVVRERLHSRARLIMDKPLGSPESIYGLHSGYRGAVLVGFHGRAGTNSVLSHTYEHEVAAVSVNGLTMGEVGVEIRIAGAYGVPVLCACGESEGMREVLRESPSTETVTVKESRSKTEADCLSPDMACELIKEGTKRGLEKAEKITPVSTLQPCEIRVVYYDLSDAQKESFLRHGFAINGKEVLIRGPNLVTAWHKYETAKIREGISSDK